MSMTSKSSGTGQLAELWLARDRLSSLLNQIIFIDSTAMEITIYMYSTRLLLCNKDQSILYSLQVERGRSWLFEYDVVVKFVIHFTERSETTLCCIHSVSFIVACG